MYNCLPENEPLGSKSVEDIINQNMSLEKVYCLLYFIITTTRSVRNIKLTKCNCFFLLFHVEHCLQLIKTLLNSADLPFIHLLIEIRVYRRTDPTNDLHFLVA